jgi:hypothetical protein
MRKAFDAYYTSDETAQLCVDAIGHRLGTVLEPHAGGGAFIRALMPVADNVIGLDCDSFAPTLTAYKGVTFGDFLTYCPLNPIDWVVGNPPYKNAELHVQQALKLAREGVGFLLRLSFLASLKRKSLWGAVPPAEIHVLSKRPSFTTDGATDSADYAFYIWRVGSWGHPTLHWI